MKLISLLLIVAAVHLSAASRSQTISFKVRNQPLSEIFQKIKDQTDLVVVYNERFVNPDTRVSISVKGASLTKVLETLLHPLSLTYHITENTIVITTQRKAQQVLPTPQRTEMQQRTVNGQVTDEQGNPLEGVTVRIKEAAVMATTTDTDGRYRIVIPEDGHTLMYTIVGFEGVESAIGGLSVINVSLRAAVSDLDEVIVVGYGTQKKANLTGSVSVVRGGEIATRPVGQTSAALQGMVPGLTVRQQSGQPGNDGGNLLIRGVGTLGSGGMSPLVLVDGVEASINNVDPNEIESISVLKDASSAAIYGSRAAGGVILVTTKRAEKPGLNIDYNSYGGWQVPTDMTDMVNGLDHVNMLNEAYTNTGRSPLFTQETIEEYIAGKTTNPDRYPDTDWQNLTMKESGFMQSHHVGISSVGENVKVLGSLGYLDQDGIIANTNFKRYSLRLNTDIKLSDKLKTSMDLFLLRTDRKAPSSGVGDIFHWMRRIPANQGAILSTGQYGEGWNGHNPLAKAMDGGINLVSPISSIINLDLNYKPVSWLTVNLVYAPKFAISHNKSFSHIIQTYNWDGTESFATPARNSLTESYSQYWYNNIRAVITFDKTIANDHHLTVLGGFQQEDQKDNELSAYREIFILSQYQEIDAGNRENERTGGNASHWALRSFFGRFNYNYQGKYLFEANARYDGSSRFATGNKYSFFPSVSAGWRITQEPFMQSTARVLSDMKIRASWGKLGNQNIGLYPFASFVSLGANNYTFDNQIITGAALNTMANSEIRWETTTVSDIGLDLILWSRFNLTADYYYRKTTDILLTLDIPKSIGLGAPYQNAGVVENKGWDLSLGYRNQIGGLAYHVTVNLSDVQNKVLDMRGVMRNGLQVNHEGYPINSLYGYEAIGYFVDENDVESHATLFDNVAPGDIKYKDQNGDGIINSDDEIIMGSHIPRYTYGGNIDLAYKGFDFSLFFQGVGKGDGYLYGQGIMPFYEGGTVQEQHKDRWTPSNTQAAFPRFAFNETNNIQNSTFWMKSAAYLRIKNVQLGYTLPLSTTMKSHIQHIRIFASGQNLLTFDSFWQGYDPEGPVGNGSWYPQMKVYNVGLNIKF